MTTEGIRIYLLNKLQSRFNQGATFVDIKAGDLHNELGLSSRVPMVCSAMKTIGQSMRSQIIESPPSMQGTRFTIRYFAR